MLARPIFLSLFITSTDAFISISEHTLKRRHKHCPTCQLHEQVADDTDLIFSTDDSSSHTSLRLSAHSSAGIDNTELPNVFNAITSACHEFGIDFHHNNIQTRVEPARPQSVPGSIGRVMLIHVSGALPDCIDINDTDLISQIKVLASEEIDILSSNGVQPILLAFRTEESKDTLEDAIVKENADYGLTDPICSSEEDGASTMKHEELMFIPAQHIQIDGAMIQTIDSPGDLHFDTSSVIVLDNLVSESLRQRLLNVVKGLPEDYANDDDQWNDAEFGPNPDRWERGGLVDIVASDTEQDKDDAVDGSCWGLTPEAIQDLCFNRHSAITEFESTLSQLFTDFTVTRLPEAVFGDSISPLTANAPTNGDSFDYHIDADPLQVPPSPWSDVFGRYPNRSRGKPRFVSCLLYLNEEWEKEWGAPTRFLDPPTQEEVDIRPKPGRCVVMDQDISHTVVAPNVVAGKRPRYSLVWKLILHPKQVDQDMTDLSCGRSWPKPQIVGSANGPC